MDICLLEVVFRVSCILHEPFPLGSVRGDSVLAPRRVIAPAKLRAQRKQVEPWQSSELMDFTAKVVIYEAFVEANSKPRRMSSHIQLTSPLDTALHLTVWRIPFSCPKLGPRS
jgi:hypothetical protein